MRATEYHHLDPVIPWARDRQRRREHLLAALGVTIGMLAIALAVVGHPPTGIDGELAGTLAYLACMAIFIGACLTIAHLARAAWERVRR